MELYNTDLEASVIGAILGNNDVLYKVIDVLSPECFLEGLHRDIFISIKDLLELGEDLQISSKSTFEFLAYNPD